MSNPVTVPLQDVTDCLRAAVGDKGTGDGFLLAGGAPLSTAAQVPDRYRIVLRRSVFWYWMVATVEGAVCSVWLTADVGIVVPPH
jgi:hypothetical protein